jgi:hypothetical protein
MDDRTPKSSEGWGWLRTAVKLAGVGGFFVVGGALGMAVFLTLAQDLDLPGLAMGILFPVIFPLVLFAFALYPNIGVKPEFRRVMYPLRRQRQLFIWLEMGAWVSFLVGVLAVLRGLAD